MTEPYEAPADFYAAPWPHPWLGPVLIAVLPVAVAITLGIMVQDRIAWRLGLWAPPPPPPPGGWLP